jgi:integrase
MPLTIYKRGKIWHYRGSVQQRRLRGSTKTADRAEAERIVAQIQAAEWERGPDTGILTFAKATILYIQAGKPSERYIARIAAHWRDTPVSQISAGAIRQAAIDLMPHASGATRNRAVIVPTQAIINHAAELELCQPTRVRRFPVEKKERRHASWQWVQAFMSASSPHLGALACFMFLTGARISEALSVEWQNVDLGRSRALIRQTKIGSERWTHLPPELVAALANIPGPREGRVFSYSSRTSVGVVWKRVAKRAGLPLLSPHACRHGFATSALQAGIDIVTVAKLGGWSSPKHVFETYGHAADDPTLTDRLVPSTDTQAYTRRQVTKINIIKSKA